jgi:hypothetical protein
MLATSVFLQLFLFFSTGKVWLRHVCFNHAYLYLRESERNVILFAVVECYIKTLHSDSLKRQ